LADQAAVAIENARLHEEAERKRSEAAALAEISRDISSSLDLSAILQKLAAHAQQITKSDLSYIGLYDPDKDVISVKASVGYQTAFYKDLRIQRGKGTGGLVLETRAPFLTNDYLNDPRFQHEASYDAISKEEGMISQLIVPILREEKTLGLMWVANRRAIPFTSPDQELLLALASQAAIAIESARQFKEEQQRSQEAEALDDVSRDITSILDLNVLLNKICGHARTLIRSDVAYIGVSEGEEVLIKYVTGARTSLIQGTRIRQGVGIGGKVLETNIPMATRDYLSDPRIAPDSHTRENTLAEEIHSQLCVPIALQERILGLLWVANRRMRNYDQRDQNTLQQLANHAAIAIENARLYEEIRQRAREMEEKNQQILTAQEELIKAQRLAAIGELGLAVAHEINNPLAALQLQADLISLRSPDLPPELQRSLSITKEMIRRMKEIVNRLQDIQSEGTRQVVGGLKMTDLRPQSDHLEEKIPKQ
jgi:GAF domain-containing protein